MDADASLAPYLNESKLSAALEQAGIDDEAACSKLVDELTALNRELCVPAMSAYGLDEARYHALLETMAEQAAASGSPANNPRQPSQADMVALYREVWA